MLSGGFAFWGENASYTIKSYQGTIIGVDTLCLPDGRRLHRRHEDLHAEMFGGSVIAWLALIPLIKLFGAGMVKPLYPSVVPIAQMDATEILVELHPLYRRRRRCGRRLHLAGEIPSDHHQQLQTGQCGNAQRRAGAVTRMNLEAPLYWVVAAAVLGFLLTWFVPVVGGGLSALSWPWRSASSSRSCRAGWSADRRVQTTPCRA